MCTPTLSAGKTMTRPAVGTSFSGGALGRAHRTSSNDLNQRNPAEAFSGSVPGRYDRAPNISISPMGGVFRISTA